MHRFVEDGQDFTNLAFLVELIYTIGVYLTLFFMYNRKQFHMLTVIFVSFEAVVMGNFVTWGHGYDQGYNNGYSANERFKKLYSPLGSNPLITFHFLSRYEGFLKALMFFVYVHAINLLPDCIWSRISR